MTLRLLSWNVRDLLGDPLAVTRVLADARADVVCLQEAPRWPGSRWRLAALARHAGLWVVGGGRGAAGAAVLSSLRAGCGPVREVPLPVRGWRTRPRGAVVVDVHEPGGRPITVASIHLGLTGEERARHVALLRVLLEPAAPRLVVAGDLTEEPGEPSWLGLSAVVADPLAATSGPTYPAASPVRRIDAVLTGGGVSVRDPGWQPNLDDVLQASDHRPVLRELD